MGLRLLLARLGLEGLPEVSIMHVRWFGEAWPRVDLPAPVCDPDYWIAAPAVLCLGCDEPIEWNHRGIAMWIGLGEETEDWISEHTFMVSDIEGGGLISACAYHIDCHLKALGMSKLVLIDRVGPKTIMLGAVPAPERYAYARDWGSSG